MNLRPALLLILSVLPLAATATDTMATVKQGSPGCMTYDLLDKLLDAILKNDQATGEGLLKNGCVILNQDLHVKILDFHGNDIEVEITSGNGPALQMWVPGKYVEN